MARAVSPGSKLVCRKLEIPTNASCPWKKAGTVGPRSQSLSSAKSCFAALSTRMQKGSKSGSVKNPSDLSSSPPTQLKKGWPLSLAALEEVAAFRSPLRHGRSLSKVPKASNTRTRRFDEFYSGPGFVSGRGSFGGSSPDPSHDHSETPNGVETDTDITLDLLDDKTFREALIDMGLEDESARLARESGQSPTILRRRLSQIPAIKQPPWARTTPTARSLFLLRSRASGIPGPTPISKLCTFSRTCHMKKGRRKISPSCSGVTSPQFGPSVGIVASLPKSTHCTRVHRLITESDLDNSSSQHSFVLSEEDPALELPRRQAMDGAGLWQGPRPFGRSAPRYL